MATCQAAKDPMNPLVVEWAATAKTALEAAAQRGIVVVSYAGCTMKVLDGCSAGGSYGFKQLTPNKDSIDIDSESKLYAELPLGVASLKGELQRGSRLTLSYVSVGQQAADGEPMGLRGSCEGATHYVRVLTVGAYSLTAMAGRGASGSAFGAGVGAGRSVRDRREVLRHSGDPDACAAAPGDQGCRAILQVGLAPLPQQAGAGENRVGFGEGLGGLAPLPTVTQMDDVNLDPGLAGADVALLKKLQEAKRQERDPAVNSEQKRAVWLGVVDYSAKHPYRAQAQRRAGEWGQVAVAEAQRARKASAVCDREVRDAVKLKELESLDDDVVPPAQKAAYRREYDRAYAPFQDILKECEGWRAKSAETWVDEALARAVAEQRKREEEAEQQRETVRVQEEHAAAQEARDSAESVQTWKTVSQVAGLSLAGVGAVLVVAGAVKAGDAKEKCSGSVCPSANQDAADSATTYGNLGIGGLGIGLVLFAGGYFWPSPSGGRPAADRAAAWRLVPGPGQAGLGSELSF